MRFRALLAAAVVALAAVASTVAAGPATAEEPLGYDTCEGAEADAQVALGAGEAVVPSEVPPALPPGAVPVVPEAMPGELVRGYAIDVTLEADGDARFHEVIDYDFGTAERHGIYRDLITRRRCDDRYDRTYPLTEVEVGSPTGAPTRWALEEGATGQRIRIGDPDAVVSGRHTYEVTYTLERVLDPFADHVELYWNVIGDGWASSVLDVAVRVTAPAPPLRVDCFAGSVGSTARCGAAAVADGTAAFAQGALDPHEALTVAIAYPPEAFSLPPPVLEERWSLDRAFERSPTAIGSAVGLGALLAVLLAVVGFRVGRDRQAVGSPVDVAFAVDPVGGAPVPLVGGDRTDVVELVPPAGLRPAQAALLLDERVESRDVTATIVDLAVRGHLRIEEVGEDGDDHRLVRLDADRTGLLRYERELWDALFQGRSAVELSSLSQRFRSRYDRVVDGVYDDAMDRRWFARRPDRTRTRWRAAGLLGLVVSGAVLGLLIAFTHLALIGVVPVVASLLVVVLAGRFPRRTPVGTGLARRVRGFRVFIEDSEAPRARWAEQRSIFTDYLPYAIAFGCADRWAATFAPLGAEAVAAGGAWYVGTHGLDPDRLGRATSRFTAEASSSLTSVPPSSSGSSGFSGGGSAGGGGGGGGGGSW